MRIAIATLGCKVNQYDSAVIQDRLGDERYSFVPFGEEADFYIINTCTVTDRADWEARQLVRRAKRMSPGARVLLTGCYAQMDPEGVSRLPGADFVVGLNRLDDLVSFVRESPGSVKGKISVGDPKNEREVQVLGARHIPGHTRAFLKIQEGCNYSCTFCIVPLARGRSRSVRPEEVLGQIRSLAREGLKEVVLTGIHLGSYGQDLKPRANLTTLVERIAESRLIPRLRLSSLDPREGSDPLLQLMASSEVLCPHLHVCLQAGEDGILKKMRRNYNTAHFRELMLRAREALPDAALGTDVIVGFPGETGEDFERSINFLDSLPLTYFHVFPYSIRSRTVAATLPGQIPLEVKRERARRVRELGAKKRREFHRQFIGNRARVLVERAADRVPGHFKGYSRNYLPVFFPASQGQVNREVEVTLEGLEGPRLRGKPVENL